MSAQGPHIPLLLCETITLRTKPYNARPQLRCTGIRSMQFESRNVGRSHTLGANVNSQAVTMSAGTQTMSSVPKQCRSEIGAGWLGPRQWDASSTEGTDVRQGRRLLIVLVRGKVTCAKVWVLAGIQYIVFSGQLNDKNGFLHKAFPENKKVGNN